MRVPWAKRRKPPVWVVLSVCLTVALALLPALLVAGSDSAELKLDSAGTTVRFTLHAALHAVHGTFKLKSGTFLVDRATGKASGVIVVDAASGDSGDAARDSKMHREVLESANYPEITFTLGEFRGQLAPQGTSRVELGGVLRLHGRDHEMTIPVSIDADGDRLSADIAFDVPYVKWGLKNPSNFLLRVSDTVQIEIHAAGSFSASGSARPQPTPAN